MKEETKALKIDRSKLKRVSTYASEKGFTPQRIYQLAESGEVKIVEIDGVKFVLVD